MARASPTINRLIAVFTVLICCVGFFAFPAYAEDVYEFHWVNLLDYGFPNGYSSNKRTFVTDGVNPQQIFFDYPVPFDTVSAYAHDIIFRTDATDFIVANNNVYLTIVSLGDGVYRCYGTAEEEPYNSNLFYVRTNNGSYIEVLSFRALVLPCYSYEKVVSGIVYDYSTEPVRQVPVVYNGDGIASNIVDLTSQTNQNGKFRAELEVYQWQSMDYIELSLSSFCSSIDSIQVQLNGVNVPFEVNYVFVNKSSDTGLALIELTIDARNLNRLTSLALRVQVTGAVQAPRSGNFVIQRCLGVVEVETPSLFTYWFTQVKVWFTDQTTALTSGFASVTNSISIWGQNIVNALGGNADTSEMESEVDNIKGELESANDAMQDFTRPDVDSVIVDVDLDTGQGTPFSDMMTGFFENEFIVSIITGALAFTLFGVIVG